MLEGLEIMETHYSKLERTLRIDAEFYSKSYFLIDKILQGALPITDLVSVSDGNHMSISEHFIEKGIPYYRGQDVHTFFIETSNPMYIGKRIFDTKLMQRSHLKKGDVLLSIVGTIGNLSLFYSDMLATCSCKLAILRKKNIKPEILAIFLMSKYGQMQIQRFTRGAVQQGLILEDMDQIKIPNFTATFQNEIKDIVFQSYENLRLSQKQYVEAQDALLNALSFTDFQTISPCLNLKILKESYLKTGRLDAEYYQPKYEHYWKTLQSQPHTFIRSEYDLITNKPLLKGASCNYVEIGDIDISDGSYKANSVLHEELPANAKISARRGDVLVSTVRPYRGAVAIVENDDNLVVSGAFTVLRQKADSNFRTEILKVLLRTPLYKDWLLQFNVGTSYPVIKNEDVLNLPIPLIDTATQTKIADYVQKSNALRREADALLQQAKSAVEAEIENKSIISETCGGGGKPLENIGKFWNRRSILCAWPNGCCSKGWACSGSLKTVLPI